MSGTAANYFDEHIHGILTNLDTLSNRVDQSISSKHRSPKHRQTTQYVLTNGNAIMIPFHSVSKQVKQAEIGERKQLMFIAQLTNGKINSIKRKR